MMRRFLLAATILVPVFAHVLSAQGWEWQNPLPHGHPINDIRMVDQNRAIAVCSRGFILRSWDAGTTWHTRMEGTLNHTRILSLGGDELLIASDQEAIIRSTDFGNTWTTVVQPGSTSATFADLALLEDGRILATLGGTRLLESPDRGMSWQPVLLPSLSGNESIRSLAVQSRSIWFIITNRNVHRTDDAGLTWSVDSSYVARGLQRLVFLDSLNAYQLREGQLLQSRDGARTWKEMDIFGFDLNLGIAVEGDVLYALSDGNFVVNKSTDGGMTWNISLTGAAYPQSWPSAISFISPERGLVAGGGGRILRTDDGGVTWSITHGLGYLGTIYDMVFTSPQRGLALTFSEALLITTNGGIRWDETLPAPGYSLRRAHLFNSGEGYAVGLDSRFSSRVFFTSDHGRTWSPRGPLPIVQDMFRNIQPQGILSVSRDTVLVSVSYGIIYRSADGGMTWDSLFVHQQLSPQWSTGIQMYTFPPRTVIHVSSLGIGVSTDMGTTWAFSVAPQGRFLSDAQFTSPDRGSALLSGSVGITTNGGRSWSLGSPGGLQLLWFFDEQRAMAFKTSYQGQAIGAVLHTSDGWATWTEHQTRERAAFVDWFMVSPDVGWAFGWDGMIRRTGNGGIVSSPASVSPQPELELFPTWPNPFSPAQHGVTNISFHVPGRMPVRLDVYSAVGAHIATLVDATLEPGRHMVALSPSRIPHPMSSGTYLVRLRGEGLEKTSRIILVR